MVYRLNKVKLQSDVYMVCLQHALSTEKFEVMGLLIGEHCDGVTNISAVIILQRSDKKKDRVEISDEQLMKSTEEAERLAKELNRNMRVVGWYHSHPHITVNPSHVDTRTQRIYQTMDSSFVGLIFSVFNEDKVSKNQEVYLTCFQTHNDVAKEIPLEIVYSKDVSPTCLETMTQLPKILAHEEEDMLEAKNCDNNSDLLITIHNNAVKVCALGRITDVLTRPLLHNLDERLSSNKHRKRFLNKLYDELNMEMEQYRTKT